MPLYISVILIIVFSSKALTLSCYNCTASSLAECSNTSLKINCDSNCGLVGKYDNNSNIWTNRTCMSPGSCVNSSLNLGEEKLALNAQCCSTDLCNSQDAPGRLQKQSYNGKRCYTCNVTDCSKILHCEGDENQCISFSYDTIAYKGCASSCETSNFLTSMHSVQCCTGDLCNDAQDMTQSLELLLAPLLYILMM